MTVVVVIVVGIMVGFFFLLLISELAQRNLSLHIKRPLRRRLLTRRRLVIVDAIVDARDLLLLIVRAGA